MCSPMKTRSKPQIDGVLIPRGARSFGKSWRNGCGTCAWNWDMHSIPRPYARRNLLLPRWLSLRSLHLILPRGHLNQSLLPTGRHSGPAHRTPKGLPELISLSSRMGRCAVLPGGPCMRKSGDQSAMVRCGCSTQRGSAIVARVCCASSVKKRRPPSKRGGSAPSIGLSLHMRRFQVSPHLPQGTLHLHWLLIRCSGEIGNGAPIGASW